MQLRTAIEHSRVFFCYGGEISCYHSRVVESMHHWVILFKCIFFFPSLQMLCLSYGLTESFLQ